MADITAALLIIGNEILSGRTRDANTAFLGQRLAARGIVLAEARTVRDEEAAVVEAVRALSSRYTYVFSTGGIGPTHDDVTAACMAKAFNAPLSVHPGARERLAAYYAARGEELNAARLRMARIPEGAALLDNPVSAAPGFRLGNVFVMAGVPEIMQGMFAAFEETLSSGAPVLSRTVTGRMRESEIAEGLEAIQHRYPELEIGSYPALRPDGGPETSLVLRGRDETRLEAAAAEVMTLAGPWGGVLA